VEETHARARGRRFARAVDRVASRSMSTTRAPDDDDDRRGDDDGNETLGNGRREDDDDDDDVRNGEDARRSSALRSERAMAWMRERMTTGVGRAVREMVDARAAARAIARARERRAREEDGAKARFVDLETGVRARYVVRNVNGGKRTVVVLHDVGECAEAHEGLARALAARGYAAYAPDCRGHGGTSKSREGRYGVRELSDDVEAFVVALDLYVRPVCLIGFGMGGVVACETARRWPRLVAATVVVECAPTVPSRVYSHCWAQAMVCASVEDVVRALASPVFEEDDEPRRCRDVLRRACRRAATCATTTTRETTTGRGRATSSVRDGEPVVRWRMDPTFYFSYDVDAFRACVETNACHFALVYGERSSLVDDRTARLVVDSASRAAKTSRAYVVPGASRHVTDDAFVDLRDAVLRAVARADDDMLVANKQARTPESLGIRPLPQYATLEDALKALAPRAVPTEAAVEAALEDARADDECPSDDDSAARFNNRTKLIQNDPEYFGFVG